MELCCAPNILKADYTTVTEGCKALEDIKRYVKAPILCRCWSIVGLT